MAQVAAQPILCVCPRTWLFDSSWLCNCLLSRLQKIFILFSSQFSKLLRTTDQSLDYKPLLYIWWCALRRQPLKTDTFPDVCTPQARLARPLSKDDYLTLNNSWHHVLDTSRPWPEWWLQATLQHPGHLCCLLWCQCHCGDRQFCAAVCCSWACSLLLLVLEHITCDWHTGTLAWWQKLLIVRTLILRGHSPLPIN